MTWQDDIATVREGYGWDDPGDLGRVEFDAALARLGARLEKADRLAEAVRSYCGTSHKVCPPPVTSVDDDGDEWTTLGCSFQPLSAALADWDGDTT